VSLIVRIMKCPCSAERRIQLKQLNEVMVILFIPKKCYHEAIESYFEWERDPDKKYCNDFCSKCNDAVPDFTKRVNKGNLKSLLCEKVDGAKMTSREFIKLLKKEKSAIFHEDDVPGKEMGQIHGLCLQLVSAGIIAFEVTNQRLGLKKLQRRT